MFRKPAFLADERNEADIGNVFGLEFSLPEPCHPDKLLGAKITPDGDNQPPPNLELLFERVGHRGTAGGDHDRIEGCVLGPAERAVAVEDIDVSVVKIGESRCRLLCKLCNTLDRVDIARDA